MTVGQFIKGLQPQRYSTDALTPEQFQVRLLFGGLIAICAIVLWILQQRYGWFRTEKVEPLDEDGPTSGGSGEAP